MRRHADKQKKKGLRLDTTKQRVPVVSDEFSRTNMRSMLANNENRYSTRYEDYIIGRLGLYDHS
jgi:hypothetical protein